MASTTTTRKRATSAKRTGAHKNGRAASSRKRGGDDESGSGKTHDIWRGVISFGLVEIPVALVSTEKGGGVSLSLLDKRDLSPVGYRRYNKSTDEEVPWSEIVHGYQYQKGRYVVVGKGELAKADPELANTIQIDRFITFSEVAPIQFDRTYYLEPLNARSKGYTLLHDALERTGKVGVARMVLRTREYVVLVAVHGPALVVHLLRFDAEIRKPAALDHVGTASVRVTEAEAQMAERLIEDMSGPWRPADYVDDYTKSLLAVIQRKVKSGAVHAAPEEEAEPKQRHEAVDLMSLLKRSVEGRPTGRSSGRASGARSTARRSATARRRPVVRRPRRARRS